MSSVTEVSKTIFLDLSDIPRDKIAAAKKEVGDLLIEEILLHVGDGKSPVNGEKWKSLKKEYADEFKGGNRTPTMQLYGDLLDSLQAKDVGGSAIKIGHFGSQAPKADGHNQLSLEAKLWAGTRDFPKRRYIPDNGQNFKTSIMREVNNILDSYREKPEERIEAGEIEDIETGIGEVTNQTIRVSINDLFSDDVINQLILEAQRRRR